MIVIETSRDSPRYVLSEAPFSSSYSCDCITCHQKLGIWCPYKCDLFLQVAFLASALGPRVAAACAHASLGSLSNESGKEGSPGGTILIE